MAHRLQSPPPLHEHRRAHPAGVSSTVSKGPNPEQSELKNADKTGSTSKFKSKYGGIEVSDVAKLKALEDENATLKRLLADQMLDDVVLKGFLGKS